MYFNDLNLTKTNTCLFSAVWLHWPLARNLLLFERDVGGPIKLGIWAPADCSNDACLKREPWVIDRSGCWQRPCLLAGVVRTGQLFSSVYVYRQTKWTQLFRRMQHALKSTSFVLHKKIMHSRVFSSGWAEEFSMRCA